MGQFVGCIRGIGEACRALDFPVVSGNVSLYNETNGRGILPTPTIGGVGLLDDVDGQCDARLQGRGRGHPPDRRDARLARPVALSARRLRPRGGRAAAGRPRRRERQRRLRARADPRAAGHRRSTTSPTAASLVALAEMAMAGRHRRDARTAARATRRRMPSGSARIRRRYVVAVPASAADAVARERARACGVPAPRIGVTGGDALDPAGRAAAI